jgi:hypothetical protein
MPLPTLTTIRYSGYELIRTLESVTRGLHLLNQQSSNAYFTMAETTPSGKQNIRREFLSHCGIMDNTPTCMCSGYKSKLVQAAHIVPKSSSNNILSNLNMDDINDTRNLLWLAPGIERTFDRMQISFIPCLTPGMFAKYKMKIWDTDCLDKPLFKGEKMTIRDLTEDQRCLDFNVGIGGRMVKHVFYRRGLAYQAICCQQYREKSLPCNIYDAGDWSSLTEDEIRNLNMSLYDSKMIINKEITEEKEDEEEELIRKEHESTEYIASLGSVKGAPKRMKAVQRRLAPLGAGNVAVKWKKKKQCYKCGEKGHIKSNCPN